MVTTAAASDGPTDEFIEEEVQADNVNDLETDMNPFELELFLKQQAKKRKAEMKDILEVTVTTALIEFYYNFDLIRCICRLKSRQYPFLMVTIVFRLRLAD